MSTRSHIAILTNTRVKSVYCQYDGYLSGNGATLLKYYKTKSKIEKLIKGGISVLEKKTEGGLPGEFVYLRSYETGKPAFKFLEEDSEFNKVLNERYTGTYSEKFKQLNKDWNDCTRYFDKTVYKFNSLEEYKEKLKESDLFQFIEYIYLFIDGEWFYSEDRINFKKLTSDLCKN